MKRLAIIGAGDLGLQIAHFALGDGHYEEVFFLDDYDKNPYKNGIEIIGTIAETERLFRKGMFDELIIGIGYKHLERKKEVFDGLAGKVKFGKIVHSSSWIDPSSAIGDGTVVYPRCILDARATISENCLLNLGCTISHDSFVGSHTFLAPSVSLAGFSKIGEMCNLGIGSLVIDNVHIASKVQLGGGSVVIKNLDNNGLYVGNPARFIR